MTLPYDWRPLGAQHYRSTESLKSGEFVAFDHEVFRVIRVHEKPSDTERPWRVILRPAHINTGDVRDRDHDKAYRATKHTWFDVYPNEHYPICATCKEPLPCRDQMAEKLSARGAEEFERYTTAGVCPACQEPVSQRQKSMTWEDNAIVPGGPPVTFHMRSACWGYARGYEQQWVKLDPERRKAALTCAGRYTSHHGGSMDCTELGECPGPRAWHGSGESHHPGYSTCHCVGGDPK